MKESMTSTLRTNWVDPMCGMQVDATNGVAEAIYIGVRYLFCSEECRRLFVQAATRHITELAHGGDCIGHRCPNQRANGEIQ
ncbi:MAG: YHS domain-containing protein [Caldilinea sp.]